MSHGLLHVVVEEDHFAKRTMAIFLSLYDALTLHVWAAHMLCDKSDLPTFCLR